MSAVELDGIVWHKSSYSAANGDCVEVAWPPLAGIAVRDSKHATGPKLAFPVTDWRTFLTKIG